MTIRTRLLTLLLCASVCQSMFPQSAAVWSNGAVDAIQQVDSTAVFRLEGKPYLQIWSSGRMVYSDHADSLQFLPVGEDVIIPVTSISLSSTEASILLGHSQTLTATVLPDNATYKTVTWTSSDSSVATVENGVVTANKLGTATITATAGTKSAECQITVLPIEVTSLSISVSKANMEIGETLTIIPTILPVNATNRNVIWKSDNESIASVDNGVVTALKSGKATISATLEKFTVTCDITVYPDGLRPQIDDWDEGGNISGEAE